MEPIKIYEDSASDEDKVKAAQKFFDENGYFEASSWVINKTESGKLRVHCCSKHPDEYYESVEHWFQNSVVYPDQHQWKEE